MRKVTDDDCVFEPIAEAFDVLGVVHDENGFGHGLLLSFTDSFGEERECTISFGALQGSPQNVREMLADAGLRIYAKTKDKPKFDDLLNNLGSEHRIMNVTKPGWYGTTFVSPLGEIIASDDSSHDIRLANAVSVKKQEKSGTLDGWKHAAGAALDCPNKHLALGIFAGVAGTLVQLAGLDTRVLNFSGESSRGKSTAQRLAASVWGSSSAGDLLFHTLRGTDNAIESLAAAANGASLHLDEGKNMDSALQQKLVFMLAGGKSKARSGTRGSLRPSKTWQTFVTFSEEIAFAQKMATAGTPDVTGTHVRCFDIDVSDSQKLEPETIADIEAFKLHFGHAGPEFVRWLIDNGYAEDPSRLTEEINRIAHTIVGDGALPTEERTAIIPAILQRAGEIMQEANLITPDYDVAATIAWVWQRHLHGSHQKLNAPQAAIEKLRHELITRCGTDVVKVEKLGSDPNYRPAVAWILDDDKGGDGIICIPTNRLTELAGGTITPRQMTAVLKDEGWMERFSNKNLVWPTLPVELSKARLSHYRLKSSFLYASTDEVDAGNEGDADGGQ